MVMWALFNSPLVMSNDLPNIDSASKKLLLNKEIIAINQDVSHPGSFNVTDAKTYATHHIMHASMPVCQYFNGAGSCSRTFHVAGGGLEESGVAMRGCPTTTHMAPTYTHAYARTHPRVSPHTFFHCLVGAAVCSPLQVLQEP